MDSQTLSNCTAQQGKQIATLDSDERAVVVIEPQVKFLPVKISV